MMKGVAVEYARDGIRSNAILPGWIETPMTEGAFSWDRFVEKVMPRVPMRRWGTGDDFGGIAAYLASTRRSTTPVMSSSWTAAMPSSEPSASAPPPRRGRSPGRL